MIKRLFFFLLFVVFLNTACSTKQNSLDKSASEILGNSDYIAISYGGYKTTSREDQPSIMALKEDMKLLSAMGVKLLRTYNVHFEQAANVLEAIQQLKIENPAFEMYVMLGAWIDCENAFNNENGAPNHAKESKRNAVEIKTSVALAKQYPSIVKIIAVGKEAMVKWATNYYVEPHIILKWVNYLQEAKKQGELSKDVWITSSDNFASWGGGGAEYHVDDLNRLLKAVDFVSMHTYPMHDTHYNPDFWYKETSEKDTIESISKIKKIDATILMAKNYAVSQYNSVVRYMDSIGVHKPVHMGETDWASASNQFYGDTGSRATDEYKQALYYKLMREWSRQAGVSCFYFEAFDEHWKDTSNPKGSENNFGLINLKGEAKYALWVMVDKGVFKNLQRDGKTITKSFKGNEKALIDQVLVPVRKDVAKVE